MKLIKCVLPGLMAWVALLGLEATAATWSTDLPAAQAKAKAENKMVLINFTALDRAKWCIRLNEEVFSQPEFDKFASNNLRLGSRFQRRSKCRLAAGQRDISPKISRA